jgi:hypothetical protein
MASPTEPGSVAPADSLAAGPTRGALWPPSRLGGKRRGENAAREGVEERSSIRAVTRVFHVSTATEIDSTPGEINTRIVGAVATQLVAGRTEYTPGRR